MPLAASTAHEVCQVASIDFPTVSDHACEYAVCMWACTTVRVCMWGCTTVRVCVCSIL